MLLYGENDVKLFSENVLKTTGRNLQCLIKVASSCMGNEAIMEESCTESANTQWLRWASCFIIFLIKLGLKAIAEWSSGNINDQASASSKLRKSRKKHHILTVMFSSV